MADFPTLSKKPSYPMEEAREDSTIRSEFDGGYQQTRQRYTRIRRTWEVKYNLMSSADKVILSSFVSTVAGGATYFNWTNPADLVVYVVRFKEPPKFSYIARGFYTCTFSLVEV